MKDKRLLLYLLLLVGLFSASRLSYMALYGLAAALVLMDWGGRLAFARVRVERKLSATKAFVGQEIVVSIAATNGSRLPLGWACLHASHPPNLVCLGTPAKAGLLPGRGAIGFSYRLIGVRRGFFRLGEVRVAGGDPLGWNVRERLVSDPGAAVTIYPPVTPLHDVLLPNTRPFGSQRDRLRAHEDPTRLGGIRDYQPGDSLRLIHWRATASLGRLQVKELVPTVTAVSMIFLNLGEAEYPDRSWEALGEVGVEAAASLVVHLTRLDNGVGLATNGRDPYVAAQGPLVITPGSGAAQAEALLTALARVEVADGMDFARMLGLFGRDAAWGTTLFLLTPLFTKPMADACLALKRTGKVPILLLLGARQALPAAAAAGLSAMVVRRARDRAGVEFHRGA